MTLQPPPAPTPLPILLYYKNPWKTCLYSLSTSSNSFNKWLLSAYSVLENVFCAMNRVPKVSPLLGLTFFFNFKFIYFFNWRIIALQNCFGFLPNLNMNQPQVNICPLLLSLPPHPIPLGCYSTLVWAPWVMQQIPIGCLFYIWSWTRSCFSLHTSHPLLPLSSALLGP